jgi:hypothetical protein
MAAGPESSSGESPCEAGFRVRAFGARRNDSRAFSGMLHFILNAGRCGRRCIQPRGQYMRAGDEPTYGKIFTNSAID